MLINRKNYTNCYNKEYEKNKILTEKINSLFEKSEYGLIPLGSIGNSIASGYSRCDEMLPLFYRTELPKSKYIQIFSFARARKNEEQNILRWYNKNISHQEVNRLLKNDIAEKLGHYACFGKEQSEIYDRLAVSTNMGMRDFVKMNHSIIIYCGLTGTFTDIFRKGNVYDKRRILFSFAKDAEYMKTILMLFYMDNPESQIYVCGIPDILGVSCVYDRYIKQAVSSIPNALYVKGAPRNIFSKLDGQKEMDIHYSKPEYLILLNHILEAIIKNFYILPFKGKMLKDLAEYSYKEELCDTKSLGDIKIIKSIVNKNLEKYGKKIEDTHKVMVDIAKYYNSNYLVKFSCTDRKELINALSNINKK